MATLDSLIFEVERLTGQVIVPIKIDYKIYFSPLAVLVLLVIFRPWFIYENERFKFRLLVWYTFLISAFIIGGFYAYAYRRFF